MVALIAAIDFVGYVAVRALGAGRGLGLTGLVGGLASSTAVTLSMSNRAKESKELATSCALAVLTASTMMFPRVLFEVAVVHRPLLAELWIPLAAMTAGGIAVLWHFYRRSRGKKSTNSELVLQNPFELSSALKWGFVFVVVLLAAQLLTHYFGRGGTYLAGFLAGTTDVDAITLSIANLAKSGGVEPAVAVTTIIIGTASNTIVKAGMATAIAGWHFGKLVVGGFAVILACGDRSPVGLPRFRRRRSNRSRSRRPRTGSRSGSPTRDCATRPPTAPPSIEARSTHPHPPSSDRSRRSRQPKGPVARAVSRDGACHPPSSPRALRHRRRAPSCDRRAPRTPSARALSAPAKTRRPTSAACRALRILRRRCAVQSRAIDHRRCARAR
jgi:hypothetical protein